MQLVSVEDPVLQPDSNQLKSGSMSFYRPARYKCSRRFVSTTHYKPPCLRDLEYLYCCVVCVQLSATGRSVAQRSPTNWGVSD